MSQTKKVRQFKLTEYPNPDIVKNIWKHPKIWWSQRPNLKAYCDLAIENDFKVPITYVLYKKYGRYFVKDSKITSSCPMPSVVRSTLFGEKEYDIDIVGCHQSIMYDLLLPNNMYSIEHLERYVMKRDEVIEEMKIEQEAIDRYNKENKTERSKKDVIKGLFTILLYGGSVDTWVNDWKFEDGEYELTDYVKEFQEELKTNLHLMLQVDKRFKDIVNWKKAELLTEYKKIHPDKPENKKDIKKGVQYFDPDKYHYNKGKVLSVILQEYERQILDKAIEWTQEKGLFVTTYNYDGFQILKEGVEEDYIELLNLEINKLGWKNIVFIKKPFKEPLDLSLLPEETQEFDEDQFWMIDDLEVKSQEFEKVHFKSMNPVCYVKEHGDGKLQYIKDTALDTMYKHLKVTVDTEKGEKEKGFIGEWIQRRYIRKYEAMDFYPPPLICPKKYYNMWCDFPILKTPFNPSINFQIILDHINLMSGYGDEQLDDKDNVIQSAEDNKKELYEYILNWISHILQKPARKTEVMLVFKGKQGAGKSTIAENILPAMIGESKAFITGRVDKAFGKFSNLTGKLLVVLNEAKGKETHDLAEIIKDSVTCKTAQLEKKSIDIVDVKDYCNYIFTTNGFNSVKVEEGDRRFLPIACSNAMCRNKQYFNELYGACENPEVMRAFYEFCMARDISNFNPDGDRPYTKLGEVLKKVNRDYIDEFVEYLQARQKSVWKAQVLYERLNKWWEDNGRKKDQKPSSVKFAAALEFHHNIKKLSRSAEGCRYQVLNKTHPLLDGYMTLTESDTE